MVSQKRKPLDRLKRNHISRKPVFLKVHRVGNFLYSHIEASPGLSTTKSPLNMDRLISLLPYRENFPTKLVGPHQLQSQLP